MCRIAAEYKSSQAKCFARALPPYLSSVAATRSSLWYYYDIILYGITVLLSYLYGITITSCFFIGAVVNPQHALILLNARYFLEEFNVLSK